MKPEAATTNSQLNQFAAAFAGASHCQARMVVSGHSGFTPVFFNIMTI